MRLKEIEERLSAIAGEIDTASGDALSDLENEVQKLTEERKNLICDVEARQKLRENIAAGNTPAKIIEEDNKLAETRNFSVDSVEYREAYLMNLQGRALDTEQRAAVTASASIPTQTLNKIVAKFNESPILSRIDMTYIPGNISIPVEGTANAASWVAMGNAATDGADTLTSVSLSAYKLIKTVSITADVQAMAIDAFETWLIQRLANKLEYALDAAVFTGSGSSQATGIMTTKSTVTGTFTKARATYADICRIIAALPSVYSHNACFAMPRALFFTDVIGIVDAAGQPVIHTDVESPAKFNILGYPVILDDNITADNILFGDFSAYKMNIAKAPQVSIDDSVEFRTGNRVYRAMALADGKLVDANAFVRYNRSAS